MSVFTIKMKKPKGDKDIDYVARQLKYNMSEEYCDGIWHELGDSGAILMAFEKYFFRAGSYTALTVLLMESSDALCADVIGFGGGNGIFNVSYGSNKSYAREAAEILSRLGFDEQ